MAIEMAKDVMAPIFSDTRRIDPKSVAVLSRSFIGMNLIPSEPNMGKLCSQEFLPGGS